MEKLIKYFVLLLFATSFSGNAQSNLDSLWNVWRDDAQPDSNKLKAIKIISWDGYLFTQPDSAFYFAELHFNYAKSKGNKRQMAIALNTQGASFFIQGDNTKALDYYTRSLKIKEELLDEPGVAKSLNNIGLIYKNQGQYNIAIDYYSQSLEIKKKLVDKKGIAASLNNIGNLLNLTGDYEQAKKYYIESLTIQKELKDNKSIATSLGNIGVIYYNLNEYTTALAYQDSSLKIREQIGDQQGIAMSLNNIGNIYKDQNEYDLALEFYNKGLLIYKEVVDKSGIAISLGNIGNIYKDQGDCSIAIKMNREALKIAQEIGSEVVIEKASSSLFECYKKMGNHADALTMHELYIETRDSLQSRANIKEVIHQEYILEYDKKTLIQKAKFDSEIAITNEKEKSRNTIFNIVVVGLIFLSILLLLLLVKLKTIRNQKRKIETKSIKLLEAKKMLEVSNEKQSELIQLKDTLIQEVHHRVKNNLQIISSLLSLQSNSLEDQKMKDYFTKAENRINLMGAIHEMLYQSEDLTRINYKYYIENLVQKITLSLKASNQHFDLRIKAEAIMLNISTSIPLSFIINEIITNSVKHGVQDENGVISVNLHRVNEPYYKLEINDNGPGIEENKSAQNPNSLGIKLINSLTKQIGGTLERSTSKKGTEYIITFKEVED